MIQTQIFIDKDELKGTKPLYEFILLFLLEKDIAGATAFVGIMGFGKHKKLKKPNDGFSFDETPLIITFVDKEEKVKKAIKELRKQYSGGLIITHPVEQW